MEHMQYLLVRSHNAENQPFHHPMEPADDAEPAFADLPLAGRVAAPCLPAGFGLIRASVPG